MSLGRFYRGSVVGLALGLLTLVLAGTAAAQSSSLYSGGTGEARPLTLVNSSWTYQPPIPPREIKLHDLITVVVDEKSQVISEGSVDRKKKADGTLTLKDWIVLKGVKQVVPAPMRNGDPTMAGKVDNKYRADSELETREAMKFRMAAEVVDIRPNGILVLEGRQMLRANEEVWEISLSGTARPEDILPNNTVLSENLADKRIFKREKGHVVDGYQRGWLLKWLDHYQPF